MIRRGIAVLLVIGCGSANRDSTTYSAATPTAPAATAPAPNAAVLMRYDLERIDGVLLPVMFSNGGWVRTTNPQGSRVLTGGRYLFRTDGTFAFGYLFGDASFDSTTTTGTYTISSDGVIRFSLGAYNAVTATVSGDRLYVKYQDVVDFFDEVYVRF